MTKTACVVGILVGCLLGLVQAASAATWSAQPAPAPLAANGSLLGISCTGATCEAVGTNLNSNGNQVPLAEKWTGSAWTSQAVPTPTGDPNGSQYDDFHELTAVSCSAASACTALDYGASEYVFGSNVFHAMRWNGTTWAEQTITLPSGEYGVLNGISCAGATACTAVGSYGTAGLPSQHLLVEVWNGSTWTAPTAALSSQYTRPFLNGVTCTASTHCVAVGAAVNATSQQVPLIDTWNGTTWSGTTLSLPAGASSARLNAISCTSATVCMAVGATSSQGLSERLSGSAWSAKTISSSAVLDAVSCSAPAACSADGGRGGSIERWNGATWTAQAPLSTPTPLTLVGISCAAATSCTAVGGTGGGFPNAAAPQSAMKPAGGQRPGARRASASARVGELASAVTYTGGEGVTVAEHWGGSTWTGQTTLNPTGAGSITTGAMSCVSATACALVGSYVDVTTQRVAPFSEVRTSAGWKIVTVPEPAAATAGFNSVSCTSATACLAVGIEAPGYYPSGMYGTWNGSKWTLGSIPLPSGDYFLDPVSVSCTAPSACVMVGYAGGSNGQSAVSESWNGTSWTTQSVQQPTGSNVLSGVSCTSVNSCQGAGSSSSGSGTTPLGEEFYGNTWLSNYVQTPSGATGGELYSVSCKTASACTAVGEWNGSGTAGGLTVRWNGSYWAAQTAPTTRNLWQLVGVSCATTTACTAVATTASTNWNGTSWGPAQRYAPPTDGGQTAIDSVVCQAAQKCIAAGASVHLLASSIPLIEAYS